jgi:lysophospholipase L1-like esterase
MKERYYYVLGGASVIGGILLYMKYKKDTNMQYNSFLGWLFPPRNTQTNQNNNILFIGDSITDIDDAKGRPTGTYPLLLRKDKPNLSIDVNALGGKTTSWMLLNLPPYLRNKKYSKVFVYGGVNDSFSTSIRPETTITNIQKMVDLAIQNGAKPYVVLGYEPVGFMDYRKMPTTRYVTKKEAYIPLIERYRNLQQLMSTQIKGATIIPKITLGSAYTTDGTHPTGKGQRIIADTIKGYL